MSIPRTGKMGSFRCRGDSIQNQIQKDLNRFCGDGSGKSAVPQSISNFCWPEARVPVKPSQGQIWCWRVVSRVFSPGMVDAQQAPGLLS